MKLQVRESSPQRGNGSFALVPQRDHGQPRVFRLEVRRLEAVRQQGQRRDGRAARTIDRIQAQSEGLVPLPPEPARSAVPQVDDVGVIDPVGDDG
jgi:hypothetical protein